MDITSNEHLKTIRRAIENNKLALFVGSAVSYDSDLPSWGTLCNLMKDALEFSRTDDYLKIAEHYYLQYGRNTYYNKIHDFFPEGSQPNKLHDLILSLKPQHIITTNWDNLLEKEINNRGDLYFTVATDYELASAPSSQLLIKMHGDLNHRNIVFKESDYLSYTDNFPLIENFIKSIFSTHIVLFVGYSISDYNLNQILSWIRNRTQDAPPSFTILTDEKITLSELNYLTEKGVYPLLCNEKNIDEYNNFPLSNKSKQVAKTLDNIINPEAIEITSVISEILSDIQPWRSIYPTVFVKILKDRLNTTEVNKVYYDSRKDSICYHLNDDDIIQNRNELRSLRKSILRTMKHISISKIEIYFSHDKIYKIINRNEINFQDEYTTFDFTSIIQRSSSININSSNDIDKHFQNAYDHYYLKKLNTARDIFLHVSSKYFSKSMFIKSLISSFNKKQLCFGEIPWEIYEDFITISMEEQLLKNDNISELIEKFPKSMTSRKKALFHGLDTNNSFLLERFKNISNLSREIDENIESINNGSMIYNENIASMYNQTYCIVQFITKNKIAVIYSSDYKNICKISFESIIKRLSLKDSIYVDEFLSYLAIVSFKEKDLIKLLEKQLINNKRLKLTESAISYLFKILDNSIKTISSSHSTQLNDLSSTLWSNSITLLSYSEHSQYNISEIIIKFMAVFDTDRWVDLSCNINRFLVRQMNNNKQSFSKLDLKELFNKQLNKINTLENIPYHEKGTLFINLLYFLKDSGNDEISIFEDNKQLEKLIYNIKTSDFKEKLNLINNFIFSIYFLSNGELKKTLSKLLHDTFIEQKEHPFDEVSIILSLNIYNIKILSTNDLIFILDKLTSLTEEKINNNSTSGYYPTIKEQIEKIDIEFLQGFEDTVEKITNLASKFETSMNNFRQYNI